MYICVPMYPGPVSIHPESLIALAKDYLPARYSTDFAHAYKEVCQHIQELTNTKNDVILATGEAMLGLWTGLKSTLKPKDKVLVIGTGLFGDGFADMAKALQCEVCLLSFPYNSTINNEEYLKEIEVAIVEFQPKMITVVHCETPSGTLNPIDGLGKLKAKHKVPLLLVDAVASIGGTPIFADDWQVDILIGGSQKCLSCPPDTTILTISPQAWEIIKEVNYVGYDALLPFYQMDNDPKKYPYTPNSGGIFALAASLNAMKIEGFQNVFKRHEEIAFLCRKGVEEIGLELYVSPSAIPSPTLTAIHVPQGVNWTLKQQELKENGVFVGGNLGKLENKVFRLGHMGTQANPVLLKRCLEVLARCFK